MAMQTRVQKWGNFLGVCIPRCLAAEVGIVAGIDLNLSAKDGKLVMKPAFPPHLSLDELLAGVSESTIHLSVEMGSAIGVEIF